MPDDSSSSGSLFGKYMTKTTVISFIFYALAFILWILGVILTRRKQASSNDEKSNQPKHKTNNWAVVDILLKLNGFIVNILFIANNAKSAGDDIYRLSIVVVILSILWNISISLIAVISQPLYVYCGNMAEFCCYFCLCSLRACFGRQEKCDDCKRHDAKKFSRWLKENKLTATILIVCSTISLEFLEFSTSRWGRMEEFNSKMNRFGKFIVFYGAIINIFIRDIPRFVIQIMYYKRSEVGNTFLLVLTGIIIFVSIISRIMYCIILISSRRLIPKKCEHL